MIPPNKNVSAYHYLGYYGGENIIIRRFWWDAIKMDWFIGPKGCHVIFEGWHYLEPCDESDPEDL